MVHFRKWLVMLGFTWGQSFRKHSCMTLNVKPLYILVPCKQTLVWIGHKGLWPNVDLWQGWNKMFCICMNISTQSLLSHCMLYKPFYLPFCTLMWFNQLLRVSQSLLRTTFKWHHGRRQIKVWKKRAKTNTFKMTAWYYYRDVVDLADNLISLEKDKRFSVSAIKLHTNLSNM